MCCQWLAQEEYDTVDSMTGLIDGLQNLGTKADFWKNDNYWNTLEDWVIENGIDNCADRKRCRKRNTKRCG